MGMQDGSEQMHSRKPVRRMLGVQKVKLPDWNALNIQWNEWEEKVEVLENMVMGAIERPKLRHWVQEGTETFGGSDKENYLPIYRRNGRIMEPYELPMTIFCGGLGSMGAGKYIDDEGLAHYFDEGSHYYILEADYLARNDPKPSPKPRRKAQPSPKPRRKAVEKDDPFNPKNHTGEIDWSTYKDNHWDESDFVIEALEEAVELQCYALDEDIVKAALRLLRPRGDD